MRRMLAVVLPPLISVLRRRCFPLPVQTIIDMTQGNTYKACVMAWWEYNGRTEFFASTAEARRVRCALKAGLLPDDADL